MHMDVCQLKHPQLNHPHLNHPLIFVIPGEDTLPSNRLQVSELVNLLENENARDIFVCRVPKDVKYVDFMVICSSNNFRTMSALAEIVRRNFKEKNEDKIIGLPAIEGARSRDWMALDLGNIALHIMSPRAREVYDLEYLWAVGDAPTPPPT